MTRSLVKDRLNWKRPEEPRKLFQEHESSPDCWCCPLLTYVDPVTQDEIWVYNDKDDAN